MGPSAWLNSAEIGYLARGVRRRRECPRLVRAAISSHPIRGSGSLEPEERAWSQILVCFEK